MIMTAHLLISSRRDSENQLDSITAVMIKSFIPSAIFYQMKLSTLYKAMRTETGVTQLQWSLLLITLTTLLYACKASSSVSYLINNCPKEAHNYPIPGLYSGIFVMYLQCHASKKKSDDNRKPNIVFYSLCVLYVLSGAVIALEIATTWFDIFVSNTEHLF